MKNDVKPVPCVSDHHGNVPVICQLFFTTYSTQFFQACKRYASKLI